MAENKPKEQPAFLTGQPKGGRPPGISQEKIRKILTIISLGETRATACRAVGIAESTLHQWYELGRRMKHDLDNEDPEFGERSNRYIELYEQMEEAATRQSIVAHRALFDAVQGGGDVERGRLALNLLSRTHSRKYGRKDYARNNVYIALQQANLMGEDGRLDRKRYREYIERLKRSELERGPLALEGVRSATGAAEE